MATRYKDRITILEDAEMEELYGRPRFTHDVLSELLERAERRQDYQRADAIKRANPASWKHVNLYGAYSFLDIGDGVDLQELVHLLEAARGRDAAAPD